MREEGEEWEVKWEGGGKVWSSVVICSFIYASSCLCCSKGLDKGQIAPH